jgi:hypothetical protein
MRLARRGLTYIGEVLALQKRIPKIRFRITRPVQDGYIRAGRPGASPGMRAHVASRPPPLAGPQAAGGGERRVQDAQGHALPDAGAAPPPRAPAPQRPLPGTPPQYQRRPGAARHAPEADPSPRTNRTRRVPHPVPIGHAASLTPYQSDTPRPSPRTRARQPLSVDMYPCGMTFYQKAARRMFAWHAPCPRCVVVHNNYLLGDVAKEYRAKVLFAPPPRHPFFYYLRIITNRASGRGLLPVHPPSRIKSN